MVGTSIGSALAVFDIKQTEMLSGGPNSARSTFDKSRRSIFFFIVMQV